MIDENKRRNPKNAGRKSVLTPEVHWTIVEALRRGQTIRSSAALAGVSESLVHRWRKRGREKPDETDRRYVEFEADVCQALAQVEGSLTFVVADYAHLDWKMAAEFLARRYPARWGEWRDPSS